jgi:hypothetical protein
MITQTRIDRIQEARNLQKRTQPDEQLIRTNTESGSLSPTRACAAISREANAIILAPLSVSVRAARPFEPENA